MSLSDAMLFQYLPVLIYLFLHFVMAERLVKKNGIKLLILILLVCIAYSLCCDLYTNDRLTFFASKSLLVFLPAVYILNFIVSRYFLLNV